MKSPQDVCCPHCGVLAGDPCRTGNFREGVKYGDRINGKWHVRFHRARFKAAGIEFVTWWPPKVAGLVLCKKELFFQASTGDTIKTEYPCSPEGAQRAADELGVVDRAELFSFQLLGRIEEHLDDDDFAEIDRLANKAEDL